MVRSYTVLVKNMHYGNSHSRSRILHFLAGDSVPAIKVNTRELYKNFTV